MIQTVAILGGHIQALGLARQVAALGLKAMVITNDSCSVARWSRDVEEFKLYHTEEELLGILAGFTPDVMVFPTSDDYIDLLVAHREELEAHCYVAIPSNETVALFANKRTTYQFCEQNHIPHPHSFYPNNMDDVREIAKQVEYPCVVKPGVMYSFHKLLGKKAFMACNMEDVICKMEEIEKAGFPIELMLIQEFLSGGAPVLYSYGAFAVDGEVRASIQANRIRQNPITFGNSTTYAQTCDIPEIEAAAKRILQLTHYTGMGEVEFMYDAQSNTYKFLEINTRAWKWHTLSNARGFSFIGKWIEYLNGKCNMEDGKCNMEDGKCNMEDGKCGEVYWVERLTDTAVVMKEILHGRMSIGAYLKTMMRKKESAVWSWRDPLPAIMYVLLSPILYIKRY